MISVRTCLGVRRAIDGAIASCSSGASGKENSCGSSPQPRKRPAPCSGLRRHAWIASSGDTAKDSEFARLYLSSGFSSSNAQQKTSLSFTLSLLRQAAPYAPRPDLQRELDDVCVAALTPLSSSTSKRLSKSFAASRRGGLIRDGDERHQSDGRPCAWRSPPRCTPAPSSSSRPMGRFAPQYR